MSKTIYKCILFLILKIILNFKKMLLFIEKKKCHLIKN